MRAPTLSQLRLTAAAPCCMRSCEAHEALSQRVTGPPGRRSGVPRLVAVTDLLLQHGLIILFGLIALESAGVPLPGEAALVAASVLAQRGHYSIVVVIVVAAL